MTETDGQPEGQSHLLVGLSSLVPGLGFWLMGRKHQAYVVGGAVLGLLLISAVAPWRSVRGLVFPLAYILWLVQIAWAVRVAKSGKGFIDNLEAQAKGKNGRVSARLKPRSHPGREVEAQYLASEIAKTQIVASERLRLSLIGKGVDGDGVGLSQDDVWYCIGLSQINLLLIELDALMKPVSTRRVGLRDILVKRYQEGYQGARLTLWVDNQGELEVLISPQYKTQTRSLLAALR
jgi:hypothetical protein